MMERPSNIMPMGYSAAYPTGAERCPFSGGVMAFEVRE